MRLEGSNEKPQVSRQAKNKKNFYSFLSHENLNFKTLSFISEKDQKISLKITLFCFFLYVLYFIANLKVLSVIISNFSKKYFYKRNFLLLLNSLLNFNKSNSFIFNKVNSCNFNSFKVSFQQEPKKRITLSCPRFCSNKARWIVFVLGKFSFEWILKIC